MLIKKIVPVNSSIDSPNNKCIFCTKNLGINSSGRPLRFCESCKAVDSLRPPIRVPSQVSPLSYIPISISFPKFTTNLKKGIWDVTPLWKLFLLKDKKLLSSKSKFRPSVMKKEKIVRKLALKGRYGCAKQCLFSSELAECNENTIAQLKSLHPVENFKCPKSNNVSYWEQNPLTNDELIKLINHLSFGKAPGPSMITFDMLKSTVNQCPECIDDLVFFFNKILTLKIKLPSEMTSSRLIALKKNESKIRPIAIGESLSRILASAVFGRIVDGASSAALSSDVFFNLSTSNYIFNLYLNAFNTVKRSSILPLLQTHFPEAESFFYNFYGSQSTLVYEEFNLISSSGVKQGDPLGPFFFCLAIHPLMCELKHEFPDVHITAYMDDISITGPIDSLRTIAEIVQQRYYQIGLCLNISKCLLIGRESADLIIEDQSVPFINYFESGFRFLGCYFGNFDEIRNQLSPLLNNCEEELMVLSDLNIEKHLKFFFLRIYYYYLLTDSAWTLNMRFRSFIWPDNLPHNLVCKCSREITTTHLLNCKHFITFRSKVHDAVRDQLYCMCKSHRIESFLEPLLSNLFDTEDDFHKNNRGDVILPGLDGSFILVDVMSVDPCNASNERLVNSKIHNPLSNAENFKFKKYNEPLSKLASLQHAKYNLSPFVFFFCWFTCSHGYSFSDRF
ncbi:hypothetical protein P9112_007731 [Eukaryota sp. TZLM1-RC]